MSAIPKPSSHKDIFDIVRKYEEGGFHGRLTEITDKPELFSDLEHYFSEKREADCAVLGIDIYKYGKFPKEQQRLIPALFLDFYRNTLDEILKKERFFFQHHTAKSLEDQFISTGDGGFQILDTPLHALLFAIYFEIFLEAYNRYANYPHLRFRIGDISLRYAMTYGSIINFQGNYFGPAMILNARILSRDHLNRFLIDNNSNEWFSHKIKGVENLAFTPCKSIAQQVDFQGYDSELLDNPSLILSPIAETIGNGIRQLHCMKIGQVQSKEAELDVYSLYLQALLSMSGGDKSETLNLMVSLGNLNSSGIW